MSSYQTGHNAEKQAAEWLTSQGYQVLELNWRTPRCEIDIVTKKGDYIIFIEVKYRSSHRQGSGFDYITPQKIKQMEFAAENWVAMNKWTGPYQLSALEASPAGFNLIEEIY